MIRKRSLAYWAVLAFSVLPIPAGAQQSPAGVACPGDRVVWVNARSGIYHFEGERYFGNTKQGKFMCQHDADREGDRPTRNGQ